MASVSVVIPCYNEAERLDLEAYRSFLRAEPEVSLVLVDDGSTDRTREKLEALAAESGGRVEVLALERNAGKAEAVRRGLLHALGSGAHYLGYWDADLATPLEDVPRFARLLDERPGIEIVFGSRVKLLGRRIDRRAVRHYAGRVFATVVSVMLRLPVYDTQCGAKLFRVTPDLEALFAEPFLARWVFDVEIIARLIAARGSGTERSAERVICEYPLAQWIDVQGSKLHPRDFAAAALDLWRIWLRYLRPAAALDRAARRPRVIRRPPRDPA